MTNLNEKVCERFRAVMATQKLSVAEYAKKSHQSYDMASRRLNGKVDLTLGDLETMCDLTGYQPIEYLNESFVLKSKLTEAQAVA